MTKRNALSFLLVLLIGFLFIGRLFYLQVFNNAYHNELKSSTVKAIYNYPNRGYIYDRNGELLVANQPSYNIMVVPNEIKNLDTLGFCNLLNVTREFFDKKVASAKKHSWKLPSVFLSNLSKTDFAILQEKMFNYPGFVIDKKLSREYLYNSSANILGYISEISPYVAKMNPYYQPGEFMGKTGVELKYEKFLRGIKGVKYIQRDKFNREIGPYKDGIYDTLPTPGKDITLTIDIALQEYGEKLMKGKRGGIVAIDPKSGEILALVSNPSYDPSLMVGRDRSKNSRMLLRDTINKPLYDRALKAEYPPGSPFKMITGLIAMQEEVMTPSSSVKCYHGYRYGKSTKAFMKCHCGIVGYPIQLKKAISKSCNSYFSTAYRKVIEKYPKTTEGMEAWSKHAKSFGLGNYLGYDLPSGKPGLIPDSAFYNRYYPNNKWAATYTISNAIGQGEIQTTPIQLANMTAAIANKGFFYRPHIVKSIKGDTIEKKYRVKNNTTISATYFDPVIEGMYEVFETGTARVSKVKDIAICGKTGTAENYAKVNGKRVKFEDHSIFVAFAPKDNPKIALAIFIENGGYGSTIAAPISSLLIEKYLKGGTDRKYWEDRMLNLSLEEVYEKQLLIENQEIED